MKKNLFSVLLMLSLVIIVSGCGKKDETGENTSTVKIQQKTQMQKKQPNALDYMAPGYNQAQDKIKQLQNIRQHAINENNNDIENVEY